MNEAILQEVSQERESKEIKWGKQRHDYTLWITVLGEEFGEACRAVLEYRYIASAFPDQIAERRAALRQIRKELIQVAAVAVATIEHVDEMLEALKAEV